MLKTLFSANLSSQPRATGQIQDTDNTPKTKNCNNFPEIVKKIGGKVIGFAAARGFSRFYLTYEQLIDHD